MPLFLSALLPLLPAIGSIFGNIAGEASANRQTGRATEAGLLLGQDRNRILGDQMRENALLGRANLDLNQRQFQEAVPQGRLNQANRADITQSLGPALQNRAPTVSQVGGRNVTSFGIDPGAFAPSQQTQDLAGLVRDRAFEAQQAGDQFTPLPEVSSFSPSPLPQASGFDTFLNAAAGTGALLGGAGEILDKRNKQREQDRQALIFGPPR